MDAPAAIGTGLSRARGSGSGLLEDWAPHVGTSAPGLSWRLMRPIASWLVFVLIMLAGLGITLAAAFWVVG
jgi:hypothetical protein